MSRALLNIAFWLIGFATAYFFFGEIHPAATIDVIVDIPESEIVDPGVFENIDALSFHEYPNIHWLESRTHFNTAGTVIVAYDPFLAAVREVNELAGQCNTEVRYERL